MNGSQKLQQNQLNGEKKARRRRKLLLKLLKSKLSIYSAGAFKCTALSGWQADDRKTFLPFLSSSSSALDKSST